MLQVSAARKHKTVDLERFSDDEILQMRIRDMCLRVEGSPIKPFIERLIEELGANGIGYRPDCYLSDEWLCPDKTPIIGIPFVLAHPRLKKIEQKMMLEVEGGTEKTFMKLLRHECGHAINYAYGLYHRTQWREHFGLFSSAYTNSYDFQPYSKRFVVHLADYYAQSHPDDDFAETFAVWLNPEIDWIKKYSGWLAIKKLLYVDQLMKRIGSEPVVYTIDGKPPFSANRMTSTLSSYYERKRLALGPEFQGYYDDSLRKLFTDKEDGPDQVKASGFLRQHRKRIIDGVSMWTGHRKYDIGQLLNKFIMRCNALGLYTHPDQSKCIIAVTALLTSIASNTFRGGLKGRR